MARSRRSRRSPPLPQAREVRDKECTEKSTTRSKVVVCIDGNVRKARVTYREGIDDVADWFRKGGALDVEIRYKGRCLTFLVQGRNMYVRGWKGRGKVFELSCSSQTENFTLDKGCIKLKTNLNYNRLVAGGVGKIPTGLFHLGNAFDKLWRHAGGEKIDISEEVAIIAVHISEAARYPYICRYICKSFTDLSLSCLEKDPSNVSYVKNYKAVSRLIMMSVDRMKAGLEPLPITIGGLESKSMDQLIDDVGILLRDGYNKKGSNFEHEEPPSTPIFENTMDDIEDDAQRKRKCQQKAINNNKRKKGGGGPKGGSVGGRRGPKGGGFGGSLASYSTAGVVPKEGVARAPASFHSTGGKLRGLLEDVSSFNSIRGPNEGVGGDPASFHSTGGPNEAFGRAPTSFHPTRGGLKELLEDMPSFSSMGETVISTISARHNELPCCSNKDISYGDCTMSILALRKTWMPPTAPLSHGSSFSSLFSFLSPPLALMKQTCEQNRAHAPLLQRLSHGATQHHYRPSISRVLKPGLISRTLKLIK